MVISFFGLTFFRFRAFLIAWVQQMRAQNVKILLAANYFDEQKIRTVAGRVGAEPVIVPLYVGGVRGVNDYFQLVDYWVNGIVDAAMKSGLIGCDRTGGGSR